MRLTFLSTSGHLGGAEASLRDVLASLRQARPAWTLVLVAPRDGRLVREVQPLGVRTIILPFPPALARFGEHGFTSDGGLAVARLARAALATPAFESERTWSTTRRCCGRWCGKGSSLWPRPGRCR